MQNRAKSRQEAKLEKQLQSAMDRIHSVERERDDALEDLRKCRAKLELDAKKSGLAKAAESVSRLRKERDALQQENQAMRDKIAEQEKMLTIYADALSLKESEWLGKPRDAKSNVYSNSVTTTQVGDGKLTPSMFGPDVDMNLQSVYSNLQHSGVIPPNGLRHSLLFTLSYLNHNVNSLTLQLSEAERQLANSKQRAEDLFNENQRLCESMEGIERERDNKDIELNVATEMIASLQDQIAQAGKEKDTLMMRMQENGDKQNDYFREKQEWMDKMNELERTLNTRGVEAAQLKSTVETMKAKLQKRDAKIDLLKKEIGELQSIKQEKDNADVQLNALKLTLLKNIRERVIKDKQDTEPREVLSYRSEVGQNTTRPSDVMSSYELLSRARQNTSSVGDDRRETTTAAAIRERLSRISAQTGSEFRYTRQDTQSVGPDMSMSVGLKSPSLFSLAHDCE